MEKRAEGCRNGKHYQRPEVIAVSLEPQENLLTVCKTDLKMGPPTGPSDPEVWVDCFEYYDPCYNISNT